MQEPEKECPECGGRLTWKVVREPFGKSGYNGLCSKCNIVLRGRETPDLRKGRKMAETLSGIHVMDKKITRHNADVQLGILRARQHCSACGGPSYPQTEENSCKCTGCNCLYCRERKNT